MNQSTLVTALVLGGVAVIAYTWYQQRNKSSIEIFSDRFGRGFPFD